MKKLYSNTLMQLILALCTFSFVACQEFDIDSQPEGPLNIQIDALESYTALATSPSNVVFNISSNTPWTIESDQQWCKPTPSMSAASSLVSEIVVTMENNTGKKARTAKLTIKAEGVEGTKVVTIKQASKEDFSSNSLRPDCADSRWNHLFQYCVKQAIPNNSFHTVCRTNLSGFGRW